MENRSLRFSSVSLNRELKMSKPVQRDVPAMAVQHAEPHVALVANNEWRLQHLESLTNNASRLQEIEHALPRTESNCLRLTRQCNQLLLQVKQKGAALAELCVAQPSTESELCARWELFHLLEELKKLMQQAEHLNSERQALKRSRVELSRAVEREAAELDSAGYSSRDFAFHVAKRRRLDADLTERKCEEVRDEFDRFVCHICTTSKIDCIMECCKHVVCTSCYEVSKDKCPFCRQPCPSATQLRF